MENQFYGTSQSGSPIPPKKTLVQRFPILASSQNPENVSLMIKGILIGLIPLALYIARQYNVALNYNEAVIIAENITLLIASSITLYGLMRRIYLHKK